jgi:branched-chain amino acid transport system permease protein
MSPLQLFLEYSLVGIASGGIYTLVALGFILIFKASGVFNFAMGEMMMFGAYSFYTFAVVLNLHWAIALALAIAITCLLAWIIERVVLRPMLGQPVIALVMVTFGIGFVLRGIASLVYGTDAYQLPEILARDPFVIAGIFLPGKSGRGFLLSIVICIALILFFRFSRVGIALRATAADQITAYSMGIDVRRVFGLAWMAAAAAGTLAGVIAASVASLTPELGGIALNVMAVVILGGMNSVGGVVLAGPLIGWLESMTGFYLGGAYRDITPYAAVLIMLMFRPHGLFGTKPVERI